MRKPREKNDLVVVKLGGSLFDLPHLRSQLRSLLQSLSPRPVLVVPGGGSTANVIRDMDRVHQLGEESAHWLALRALTLNAHWLQHLLPNARIIASPEEVIGDSANWYLLDGHAFCQKDEENADHLPHNWYATSDSLAVRVGVVFQARNLLLLKSIDRDPHNPSWGEAAERGFVDPLFPELMARIQDLIEVQVINLRTWQSPLCHGQEQPVVEPSQG